MFVFVVIIFIKIYLDFIYLDCFLVFSFLVVSFGNFCWIVWEMKERIEKLGLKVFNKFGKFLINFYFFKCCWFCGIKFVFFIKV